ncbi:MAG: heme ABC exporter ATP-binding protein CcmA [Acidimicrobiia bacterium]|nr:heme ABC exporter ATP-binding protein CcmA [Acidimicrobiia bacterium]
MEPLLSLDHVAVAYGQTPVLGDATLSVVRGEVVALRGPNGSGKSTLLRVLATLLRPASGSGVVFGERLGTREVESVRHRIGLIAHQPALYAELTLEENLALVADLAAVVHTSPAAALEAVGLAGAAHRRAGDSSQGMLRRADLARLLITEPDLLLLDEPHSGLDVDALGLVDALVRRCLERGGAAVVVSHLTDLGVDERTVSIVGGKLVA